MADKAYRVAFGGRAVVDSFYADVVSLVIDESTSEATTLRLRLTTRLQDDGSWTYLEDDRFAPFNSVSVSIGFVGGGTGSGLNLVPVFAGYVTGVEVSLGSAPATSTLEIVGLDTSVLLGLEEKVATFPNLSDGDIAQQVLGGYGVTVQADSTSTVHQENDTTIVQRGTDAQFVRQLAQRNGFDFYFEPDPASGEVIAHFHAPRLEGTPQPDLAIQFADRSNLRSFAARLTVLRPLTVKTQQIDVKTNTANSAQIADTQLDRLGDKDLRALAEGALGSLVTPREALAQMLVLGPPTSDAGELRTIAQAVRDEAGWLISAVGEVNTEAYQTVLRPRRVVLVRGAGTAHSGKYFVTSVTHEMRGDGGYVQRFTARRNARDLDGSERFGQNQLAVALPV